MDSMFFRIDNSLKVQMPDTDVSERQSKIEEVMFADVIAMNSTSQADDFTVDVVDDVVGGVQSKNIETRKEKPTDAYEKYQYKDKTIRSESKSVSEEDMKKVEEEVTEFVENVTEVIKEELHVTKEEIEAAMDELGLTFLELLDVGKLANLVSKLQGEENANQLLCNEAFTNIFQQLNVLGKELISELQISPEELSFVLSELEKTNVAEMEMTSQNGDISIEENDTIVTKTKDDVAVEIKEDTTVKTKDDVIVEADDEVAVEMEDDIVVKDKADVVDETVENTDEISGAAFKKKDLKDDLNDNSEGTETSEEEMTGKHFVKSAVVKENVSQSENHTITFDISTNNIIIQPDGTETLQSIPTYISVSELIEQFTEQARVHITQDTTKMEMLLNPEHLGKIYLEITEQEGTVTAKIQTQNAIVKEALEMQIADLRQNLNQAGVKVDSIEVTIASHEFERNLEQDANSKKQQENAQVKPSRMRNINMNELDGLSGLMTEEETIVAKMMAEQGNRVNFTA